jgi:hypothetical protein
MTVNVNIPEENTTNGDIQGEKKEEIKVRDLPLTSK